MAFVQIVVQVIGQYIGLCVIFFTQIPVVVDLPVGENLENHVMTTMLFRDKTKSAFNFSNKYYEFNARFEGKGIVTK